MKVSLCKLVVEGGAELQWWDSYSVNSDFMTPSDGWSLSLGGDSYWTDIVSLVQPDSKVQIWVDGVQILTGFVDIVRTESSASTGVRVNVQGRDMLRPLIKANIHPGFSLKGLTVAQMVEKVVEKYYREPRPTVYYDSAAERTVLGLSGAFTPKDRSAAQKKVIDFCAAHPNEGAFEFLARNLRRFGLWLWATPDGNLVVSGPTYDQAPAYDIIRRKGERGIGYLSSTYTQDHSTLPSFIEVRGKATAKEWDKATVRATASDLGVSDVYFNEPLYVQHDQAETQEQAQAFALQELTRLQENSRVYETTSVDHRDQTTGNIFAINTVASVEDDFCHVRERMWVSSVTFNKSVSSGTTTSLKLLPLHAIQLGEFDIP